MNQSSEAAPIIPPRVLYTSFAVGLGSLTLYDIFGLLVPLFALSIDAGPAEIGLLVGARAAGPALFAMHGGGLVDRFGSRRVLLGASLITAVIAILIPALPWFWPLFFLQLGLGLITTFNWLAAQTLAVYQCRGDTAILGRYNFVVRWGTIAGPPAAGALWDYFGAWPTFGIAALTGVALHFLARTLAEPHAGAIDGPKVSFLSVLPRVSDYTRSLSLILIPVIAFTIMVSTLRNGTNGLQTSIYVVYLEDLGYQGTLIGILFGASEAAVALASLFVGTAKRLGPSHWVLLATTAVAILAISATPFLGGQFPLLLLMMVLLGGAQGFMQPIVNSIQFHHAGSELQGAMTGLRMTANRISNMIVPPVAGYIAGAAGIAASFVLIGGVFLVGAVAVAILVALRPRFRLTQ